MAVKIRLMRVGKKKQPTYRVVVADARSPRDGRFIEIIGQYAPRQEPSVVQHRHRPGRALVAAGRAADRAGREAPRDHRRVGRVQGSHRQGRGGQAEAADAEGEDAEAGRRSTGARRRPCACGRSQRRRAPRPTSPTRRRARGRASRRTRRRPPNDATTPTTTTKTSSKTSDDDYDDDEIAPEGNRAAGGRAKAVVELVARHLVDDPDGVFVDANERRDTVDVADPREPRRHGPHHRQARPRDPGAAPGRPRGRLDRRRAGHRRRRGVARTEP